VKDSSSLRDRKSFFNSIGHSRHFERDQATSALAPIADISLRRTNDKSLTGAVFYARGSVPTPAHSTRISSDRIHDAFDPSCLFDLQ
jgi:hypothetical protein